RATPPLCPYTTLCRSEHADEIAAQRPGLRGGAGLVGARLRARVRNHQVGEVGLLARACLRLGNVQRQARAIGPVLKLRLGHPALDRKSTRLNSSHVKI